MRKMLRFVRTYYLFTGIIVAAVAGLILQLLHQALALHWVLGTVSIIAVMPLLIGMWRDLHDGSYGIDILAAAAIISAVAFHQYWAAIVIVIMLTGGEALEDFAEHRAKTELDALLQRAPVQAHRLKQGKVTDIPVGKVNKNDLLIIRPGEVVPVDCQITEGSASFDESSLTGESLPQAKDVGGTVLAGAINLDGVITAKALRPASESQYEQILKLVRAAGNSQTPFVRIADRFSVPFTLLSFGIAIAAWIVSKQSIRFLEVLVVATPCPLILAAPIAVISGMSRAARHGIIIKNGGALERTAEAQVIAFDKTGTLTKGLLKVDGVTSLDRTVTKDEVLRFAASLEQGSNHVLAVAINKVATKKHLKLLKVKNLKEIPGRGLTAVVRGQRIIVGRIALLQDEHIDVPNGFQKQTKQTATFVAVNEKLLGYVTFTDEIRQESAGTLATIRKLGLKRILMITGDNKAAAQKVAQTLGITEVVAEALPADKLKTVEEIKTRPVIFVGDGINDAPVLTAADIGIALGARGETAASESADIVILLDDVSKVAQAVAIAKHTFAIARQSIVIGILLSIVLMLAFSTGRFHPLYGAFLQELVDVVVIFNALRAHGSLSRQKA